MVWKVRVDETNYINGKYIKTFLACGQNEKSPQKLKQAKQIYTLF